MTHETPNGTTGGARDTRTGEALGTRTGETPGATTGSRPAGGSPPSRLRAVGVFAVAALVVLVLDLASKSWVFDLLRV